MCKSLPALLTLGLLVLLTIGCSSDGGTPIAPDTRDENPASQNRAHQVLLGLYGIEIDTGTLTAEIIPIRDPAFQVNVLKYLQPPIGDPANLGISINPDGTDISEGLIDLDVSITHPFPGSNLRGFDVRGIVLGEKGTRISQFDPDVLYPGPDDMRLLNADGYTRWWNAVEFLTPGLFGYTPPALGSGNPQATVNGYKYFADGLESADPPDIDISSRGTFSTEDGPGIANTLTRQYIIQFPMVGGVPRIRFGYAILASFAAPESGTTPPGPVEAYPIEANCPEAYQLSINIDPASTAWYSSTGQGGDLVINLEIFDWQSLENPDGVRAEIAEARLESPDLWGDPVDPISLGVPIETGNPTSSIWQVEIESVTPAQALHEVFITVESADPSTYAPPVPGAGVYPGGAHLATYLLATIELPENSPPVIGEISGPRMYTSGAQLTYTLSSMTDYQDGPNLTVYWDFDSDGVFEDDEDGFDSNMTGTYTFTGDETWYVQCRVFDTEGAYTDSNTLTIEPIVLPYVDPMDANTEDMWTVENGIFDIHSAPVEWNLQTDHWSSASPITHEYEDQMNTTLISPLLPAGVNDTLTVMLTHRYWTENGHDDCEALFRINSGPWTSTDLYRTDESPDYPGHIDEVFSITGLSPGDVFEIGFAFDTDESFSMYPGWDIDQVIVSENLPPVIEGINGPDYVETLGPWTYSTVVTDLDNIVLWLWSVENEGLPPVYDDPGDGMGNIDVTFPADGTFEIWVEVTDDGFPPLTSFFGPKPVLVAATHPDPFFIDHFTEDTGAWTYTGGIGDGSYQDFWHIETGNSLLSNVGPDGCYAEKSSQPIEKTAGVDITFPDSSFDTHLRILHRLGVEDGGNAQPFDGQWVTLDGIVIDPLYGFLYDDNDGVWDHGYFVGETDEWEPSAFILGTDYNDGLTHTLTLHSLSIDTYSNCLDGWQIDVVELWLAE